MRGLAVHANWCSLNPCLNLTGTGLTTKQEERKEKDRCCAAGGLVATYMSYGDLCLVHPPVTYSRRPRPRRRPYRHQSQTQSQDQIFPLIHVGRAWTSFRLG